MRAGVHSPAYLAGVGKRVLRRRPDGQGAISRPPAGTQQPTPSMRTSSGCDIAPLLGFSEAHGILDVFVRVNRPRHPERLRLTINKVRCELVPKARLRAPFPSRQA